MLKGSAHDLHTGSHSVGSTAQSNHARRGQCECLKHRIPQCGSSCKNKSTHTIINWAITCKAVWLPSWALGMCERRRGGSTFVPAHGSPVLKVLYREDSGICVKYRTDIQSPCTGLLCTPFSVSLCAASVPLNWTSLHSPTQAQEAEKYLTSLCTPPR